MNECQVILQDQLHFHLSLEEGLWLEYNCIPDSQIRSRFYAIDLALALWIDKETLSSISDNEGICQPDDLFKEFRCVIAYDYIIKYLILKLEMIWWHFELFFLWLLWLHMSCSIRWEFSSRRAIPCEKDSFENAKSSLEH